MRHGQEVPRYYRSRIRQPQRTRRFCEQRALSEPTMANRSMSCVAEGALSSTERTAQTSTSAAAPAAMAADPGYPSTRHSQWAASQNISVICKVPECRGDGFPKAQIIGYPNYCVGPAITLCCYSTGTVDTSTKSIEQKGITFARSSLVRDSHDCNKYHLAPCC
jgi:hypothetical protein